MLMRPSAGASTLAVRPAATSTLTVRRRKWASDTRLSDWRPAGSWTSGASAALARLRPCHETSMGYEERTLTVPVGRLGAASAGPGAEAGAAATTAAATGAATGTPCGAAGRGASARYRYQAMAPLATNRA